MIKNWLPPFTQNLLFKTEVANTKCDREGCVPQYTTILTVLYMTSHYLVLLPMLSLSG